MIEFLTGLFLGGSLGTFVMALLSANAYRRGADDVIEALAARERVRARVGSHR